MNNENIKIVDSIWFTEYGNIEPIGIVLFYDKHDGYKCRIGTGFGTNLITDCLKIIQYGASFPMSIAKQMFYIEEI